MTDKEMMGYFDTNAKKKMYVAKFYTETDRSEEAWNDKYKSYAEILHETAMGYLKYEDVQNCIKAIYSEMRTLKMLELYDAMYEKAMSGDVNSAKWVESFNNSDFFVNQKNAIDEIIDGFDMNE